MKSLKTMQCLFIAIVLSATVSCSQKEETKPELTRIVANYDKLHRFVSIISNIPQEELEFNLEKKEFYLPKTEFHLSLEDAQKYYSSANVYKEHYEK